MKDRGLIHIYCGDGKGKTTAAVGLAVRAAGRGKRVLISRFLKTEDSGEVAVLRSIPGITVLPCDRNFGFSWNMTQVQRKAAALYYDHCLLNAWNMALGADGGEPYDMLVLDEAIGACNLGFVDEAGLVKALKEKPAALEVILTGRCPSEALRDQADYITEMVMRRHPYERGVGAREGIEY